MYYIVNQSGVVLFRSKNKETIVAKANAIIAHGNVVTVTTVKPAKPKAKYFSILSYNDPIEC